MIVFSIMCSRDRANSAPTRSVGRDVFFVFVENYVPHNRLTWLEK